jgi:hypothetical protein
VGNVQAVGPGDYWLGVTPGGNAESERANLAYRITVTNTSTDKECDVEGLKIEDYLGDGFKYAGSEERSPHGHITAQPQNGARGGLVELSVSELAPGQSVEIVIYGTMRNVVGKTYTNTATASAEGTSVAAHASVTTKPAKEVVRLGGSAAGVHGSVDPADGPLQSIAVALEILIARAGAHHAGSGGCRWLRDRNAQFSYGACEQPIWLAVKPAKHWRLTFTRPLRPGRYEVRAVAVSKNGLTADTLAPGAGDTATFTVR